MCTRYILFGAGEIGKLVLRIIGKESVLAFCDNNRAGGKIEGIPILLLEEIEKECSKAESQIVISYGRDGKCYQYNQNEETSHTPYISMVLVKDMIVVIPKDTEEIICIDKRKKALKRSVVPKIKNRNRNALFSGHCIVDNKLVLFPWGQELMYELNYFTGELTGYETEVSITDYYTVLTKMNIHERKKDDLYDFIEYIRGLKI